MLVKPMVSIVTPLFNEEAGIPRLALALGKVLNRECPLDWEWVAVDDGSQDMTFATIQKEITTAPSWQIVRLSRNFGQQAAYRAGLEAARGEAVVFLDADLQDPPTVFTAEITDSRILDITEVRVGLNLVGVS
ncbi:MAG: glycosyltransferase, partial [Verrucomicrobia bacterium]|nr:glycosyltransferase [Verrucomicrobiota bacterium]